MQNDKNMNGTFNDHVVLVTGGAGFIGSHIVDALLRTQIKQVIVLDNLSTGNMNNIAHHQSDARFCFVKGDIRNEELCHFVCKKVTIICHQAAIGSVQKSINNPKDSLDVNIIGMLNIIQAAKNNGIKRFVYASSSSVYGEGKNALKKEDMSTLPISPYGATKHFDETMARIFSSLYPIEFIGLRYFNVFGARQNPKEEYAAVIPKFITCALNNVNPTIYGDGKQSRDFTHVSKVVDANLIGMTTKNIKALNKVYNVSGNENVTILELWNVIKSCVTNCNCHPIFEKAKIGDVRHSSADSKKYTKYFGNKKITLFKDDIEQTIKYYKELD